MKKRIASLLLAALMLAGVFTACSSGSSSTSTPAASGSAASGSTTATDSKEPVTITMVNRLPAEFVITDNPIFDEIERLTGVRLEVEAPPIANYSDRLQLVMASGDIPDIIYTWEFDANYEKWANDGMLMKLDPEKLAQYPNLMANINEDQWNYCRVGGNDGDFYAVPRPNTKARWARQVNIEWMKKLGVEKIPETPDELYEYAKLVANNDPDGNGKKDTFLYSPTGLWSDCWLVFGFMPFSTQHMATYLPDPVDGKYKVKEKMTGYMPYLDFVRKLYAEGLMDPEWFTNNYYDDRTKFQQERVAMLHGGAGQDVGWVTTIPDAPEKFTSAPALIREGDEKPVNENKPATWGGWMINAELDEAKLDRVLEFLDWANSPEGFTLFSVGIQGKHYETFDLETHTLTQTPEQVEACTNGDLKGTLSGYMSPATAYKGEPASYSSNPDIAARLKEAYDTFDASVEDIIVPSLKCPEIDNWAAENPDIATKKEEMEVKYVCGEISREDFEAFLNDTYFPSIEEAEKVYIEMMEAYDAAK